MSSMNNSFYIALWDRSLKVLCKSILRSPLSVTIGPTASKVQTRQNQAMTFPLDISNTIYVTLL